MANATKSVESVETKAEFNSAIFLEQLTLLAHKVKPTVNTANDDEIRKLKNFIVRVRTIIGSGGNFKAEVLVDGNVTEVKADSGIPVGITSLFDDLVVFQSKNGMTEVTPIISRDSKRGRKPSEVLSADSFSI